MFGEVRLVRASTHEQIAVMRDPGLVGSVKIADDRGCGEGRRFPLRPAGGHRRRAEGVREALSQPDRVICATPLGTPLEDLDRFAKEVIPASRDTRTAAVA